MAPDGALVDDATIGHVPAGEAADPDRFGRAATALRLAGRLDDAEQVLDRGKRLFPDDIGLRVERAWLTQARGDWPRTAASWQALRQQLPDRPEGYAGGAIALRVMGRLAEAAQLIEDAAAHFPDNPMLHVERAWIAQQRHDWPAAEHCWSHVRSAFPDLPDGSAGLATVYRVQGRFDAAAQVLRTALDRFPHAASIQAEAAWLAQSQGDWAAAATRWEALRHLQPAFAEAYRQLAVCLRSLGQPDAAMAALQAGCQAQTNDVRLHLDQARLLLDLHRWDAARHAYAAIRTRWSERNDGVLGEAAALVGENRFGDADTLLRDASAQFPDDPAIALARARLPVAKERHDTDDRAEAAVRLRDVTQRFPSLPAAWLELIRTLRNDGAYDEADRVAGNAMRACPQEAAIAADWAMTAQRRGDASTAVRRLRVASRRFPAHTALTLQLAQSLGSTGSHAAAGRLLATVSAAERGTVEYAIATATLATHGRDWATAAERWAEAERRFPRDAAVAAAAAQARLIAVEAGAVLAERPGLAAHHAPPTSGDATPQAVLRRFESLGGSPYGCEFGFVQRAHALEPLGLLRWTAVPPARLVTALDARFEGVGEPAQTELIQPASPWEEYRLRDRRFGLRSHTHTTPAEIAPEAFFRRACLRQQFLRRRLLQRLAAGMHVFVYRLARQAIDEADLLALHQAIRAHGSGTLLYVRQSRCADEDDTVEYRAPGLLVGSIARFAVAPSGAFIGAATEHWVTICRLALERLREAGEAD